MTIQVGAEAPDFELASNLTTPEGRPGKKVKLSDYRGKKNVVLAFYPLDFSPVCSGEMACFKNDLTNFESANTEVIGVSVDSHWTHAAFAKAQGLAFPLVADFHPRGAVADTYGLYEADKGITSRATVIVDKAGKVAYVKNHGLGTARDDAEILAELAKLGLVPHRRSPTTVHETYATIGAGWCGGRYVIGARSPWVSWTRDALEHHGLSPPRRSLAR